MGGFTGFKDGEDVGVFPYSREVSVVKRKVIKGGEIGNSFEAQMLEVEN